MAIQSPRYFFCYYRLQAKFAKVMFSQVFICPWEASLSKGGSLSRGLSLFGGAFPQWGLCLGGLSRGVPVQWSLCPVGSMSRGVSVQGVCGGLSQRPPLCYSNVRVVRILLECILVFIKIALHIQKKGDRMLYTH